MDKNSLKSDYDKKQEWYNQVKDTATFIVSQAISGQKIKYHSLTGRIKRFDSFFDKIKRKKIKNPFEEIHDVVGLRIVCLFLDDIKILGDIIKNAFEVVEEINIIDNSDPRIFEYLGTQFKVKFKDKSSIPNYENIRNIPFEVQVRTIAQDAWAAISHHLDYKQDFGVPGHLKRDFYALSGLFYIADTHFEILKKEQFKYLITKK